MYHECRHSHVGWNKKITLNTKTQPNMFWSHHQTRRNSKGNIGGKREKRKTKIGEAIQGSRPYERRWHHVMMMMKTNIIPLFKKGSRNKSELQTSEFNVSDL